MGGEIDGAERPVSRTHSLSGDKESRSAVERRGVEEVKAHPQGGDLGEGDDPRAVVLGGQSDDQVGWGVVNRHGEGPVRPRE